MSPWKTVPAVLTVACSVTVARADSWGPPTPGVFAAENGSYWVKTDVDGRKTATAALMTYNEETVGEGADVEIEYKERVVWKQDLGYIPAKLLVSAWGNVVGVNRYAHLGYEHSLVVWNKEGKQLADYRLEDLLTPEEIRHFVDHSTSSRWWDVGARVTFDSDERLDIELEWGKVISVDLLTGKTSFSEPASALPEPMTGFADEAVFVFFMKGERVGELACSWRADGSVTCEGTAVRVDAPDPYKLVVTPDVGGRWKCAALQFGDYSAAVVRDGTLVRQSAATACTTSRPFDEKEGRAARPQRLLKPRSVFFDYINAPILWSQLIRLYDRERGGPQPFHFIMADAHASSGALQLVDTQTRLVNGREMSFDRYAMNAKTIWADRSARIYMIEQADNIHDIFCARKGYEDLRQQAQQNPGRGRGKN